jgi:hypothetical protein
VWRSLVAHLHGVQGVEGSNPFTPTNKIKDLAQKCSKSFLLPKAPCPARVRIFDSPRFASGLLSRISKKCNVGLKLPAWGEHYSVASIRWDLKNTAVKAVVGSC